MAGVNSTFLRNPNVVAPWAAGLTLGVVLAGLLGAASLLLAVAFVATVSGIASLWSP
jgi:hypothetical protein